MGWFMSAPLDSNVYALNASTGAKLWSYPTGSACVFLARGGEWGGLCRLRRRQRVCAERQHRRKAVELYSRIGIGSSPAVANGVVYIGSDDGNVVCAERQHRRQAVELCHRRNGVSVDPRPPWRMGLCISAPLLQRICAERQHRRQAVELSDPNRCWILSSPAVANGVVYVGSCERDCMR